MSARRPAAPAVATVGELLAEAERRLEAGEVEFPDTSALWLLAAALGELEDPDALEERPERAVEPAAVERFHALVARREAHEPFQYLAGVSLFRDVLLEVERGVFLPRSQSERMCDEIEEWAAGQDTPPGGWRVADLGTGSGAIAVSLARGPLAPSRVWAMDLSPRAAALAGRNAARAGVADRLLPVVGDWLTMVRPEPCLDIVTVVPPYLNPGDEAYLSEETMRWEPLEAFFGEPSGDELLRHLIDEVALRLRPGGLLACQLDTDQAEGIEDYVNEDPDHPLTVEWILIDDEGDPDAIMAVKEGP